MASNGPRQFGTVQALSFATDDLERLRARLSAPLCGFDVHSPAQGTAPKDVIDHLESLCERCVADDVMICYFSGHGILDSKGNLVLLWDHSDPLQLLTSTLSVRKIMAALEACQARNRLFILDCCHAGAVVNMTGLKGAGEVSLSGAVIPPDNYAVLMASGRMDKARELVTLRGSFFTDALCAALGDNFRNADIDRDGRLSVADLGAWLADSARYHNEKYPTDPVPYPSAFGKYRGDFFLTVSTQDWTPIEIDWPDGTTMVVLPIRDQMFPDLAICMGKHPVTNRQYKKFFEADEGRLRRSGSLQAEDSENEPVGQSFRPAAGGQARGSWEGPFRPWRDKAYRDVDQPVVCVPFWGAQAYCLWVRSLHDRTTLTCLPSVRAWQYGAFGTAFPARDPRLWMRQSPKVHHKADAPAAVERSGERTNGRGLSDMIGNVWEWCIVDDANNAAFSVLGPPPEGAALRGGGFLDDLTEVEPFLDVYTLRDQMSTSHADLGFRIAAVIPISKLPDSARTQLYISELVDRLLVRATAERLS